MPFFTAGERATAAKLNQVVGQPTAYATASLTRNNTTTFANIVGLSVNLEANSLYFFKSWIYVQSNPTADAKILPLVPAGATGFWSANGPVADTAPIAGSERKNYGDFGVVPISSALVIAGDDEFTGTVHIAASPTGWVQTAGTAGTLQMQGAQNVANVSNTLFLAGSWMTLTKATQ